MNTFSSQKKTPGEPLSFPPSPLYRPFPSKLLLGRGQKIGWPFSMQLPITIPMKKTPSFPLTQAL